MDNYVAFRLFRFTFSHSMTLDSTVASTCCTANDVMVGLLYNYVCEISDKLVEYIFCIALK